MRADKHTKPSGSAAKRVLKGVGKVLGTMVLVLFLTTLIFACLFALYVKNDLVGAGRIRIDGFTLDQTSVIYYEDPEDRAGCGPAASSTAARKPHLGRV